MLASLLLRGVAGADQNSDPAKTLVDRSGVQGGLIVHLGSGDGKLTAALRVNDRYQVHGLDDKAENIAAARKLLDRRINTAT